MKEDVFEDIFVGALVGVLLTCVMVLILTCVMVLILGLTGNQLSADLCEDLNYKHGNFEPADDWNIFTNTHYELYCWNETKTLIPERGE